MRVWGRGPRMRVRRVSPSFGSCTLPLRTPRCLLQKGLPKWGAEAERIGTEEDGGLPWPKCASLSYSSNRNKAGRRPGRGTAARRHRRCAARGFAPRPWRAAAVAPGSRDVRFRACRPGEDICTAMQVAGWRLGNDWGRPGWDHATGRGGCRRRQVAEERSHRSGRRAQHGGQEICTPRFMAPQRPQGPLAARSASWSGSVRFRAAAVVCATMCRIRRPSGQFPTARLGLGRSFRLDPPACRGLLRSAEGAPPLPFAPRIQQWQPLGRSRGRLGPAPARHVVPVRGSPG